MNAATPQRRNAATPQRRNAATHRFVIAGMLLVSLFSALLAAQLGTKVAVPDLVAEPAQIDLERVEQGKSYKAKFLLRNSWQDELRIAEIVGSCSCTSHVLSLSRIPAGGQSQLTLTYDSGSSCGDISSKVTVFYFRTGERQLQKLECRILANVEPNISVSPNPVRFASGNRSAVVQLKPQRIKSFQVFKVACSRAEITCKALDRQSLSDTLEVKLEVDVERLPSGIRTAELIIETSDAAVPMLRVPIQFAGGE